MLRVPGPRHRPNIVSAQVRSKHHAYQMIQSQSKSKRVTQASSHTSRFLRALNAKCVDSSYLVYRGIPKKQLQLVSFHNHLPGHQQAPRSRAEALKDFGGLQLQRTAPQSGAQAPRRLRHARGAAGQRVLRLPAQELRELLVRETNFYFWKALATCWPLLTFENIQYCE